MAEEAADKTVKSLFLHLGYDISSKEELLSLRADLRHLNRWRKATETIGRQGIGAAITVLVAGLLAALWLGAQGLLGR